MSNLKKCGGPMKKIVKALGTKHLLKQVNEGKINFKKLAGLGVALVLVGLVGVSIVVILSVVLLRWGWGAFMNEAETNPTVSNVIEGSKEEVANLLPTIPSSATDFISNGQIDQEKIEQTYNQLPAATQEVWRRAITESITKELENATGVSAQTLRELQSIITNL